MNYDEALEYLTSKDNFKIELGLDRIKKVLDYYYNPQDDLKIIHVAGTNGKGSTCLLLSKVLEYSGFKTGLFTSPHIKKYNERIKINGLDISDTEFSSYVLDIADVLKKIDVRLTEFEILTVIAFLYFKENNVDYVVLETGLGGRLDATNAISDSLCSIITSISLEHREILGDTIDKIATEKAGIVKDDGVCIVNESNLGFDVLKNVCLERNARLVVNSNKVKTLFFNGINYACFNNKQYEFSLLALWQKENLELVLTCLGYLQSLGISITEEALEKTLKTAEWPARFQYYKSLNLIVDGAHNPDAAKKLRESIDFYFRNSKKIFIYGTLKNKDYKAISNILFKADDKVLFYEFKHDKSAKYEDVKDCINCQKLTNMEEFLNFDGLKIISGSFYMIDELLTRLKI